MHTIYITFVKQSFDSQIQNKTELPSHIQRKIQVSVPIWPIYGLIEFYIQTPASSFLQLN